MHSWRSCSLVEGIYDMKQVELNDVGRIVVDAFGHLLDSPSWLRLHGPLCCWMLITYRCIQLWELPSAEGNCLAQVSALQFLLLLLLLLSCFSHVRLCATPEMAAHQAPLSLRFSRQEHWSGLPFPSPMHESEK